MRVHHVPRPTAERRHCLVLALQVEAKPRRGRQTARTRSKIRATSCRPPAHGREDVRHGRASCTQRERKRKTAAACTRASRQGVRVQKAKGAAVTFCTPISAPAREPDGIRTRDGRIPTERHNMHARRHTQPPCRSRGVRPSRAPNGTLECIRAGLPTAHWSASAQCARFQQGTADEFRGPQLVLCVAAGSAGMDPCARCRRTTARGPNCPRRRGVATRGKSRAISPTPPRAHKHETWRGIRRRAVTFARHGLRGVRKTCRVLASAAQHRPSDGVQKRIRGAGHSWWP